MNLLEKYLAYAEANRFRVFATASALAGVIAFADWRIAPDLSLGFLYIFPILLTASLLSGVSILISATFFSFLREALNVTERWTPGTPERFVAGFLCFAGAGFFVAELDRMRRLAVRNWREAEQQARLRQATERQLQVLVETSPLAVLTLDDKGQVLLANESAHRLLGFPQQQLLGEDIRPYLPVLGHLFGARPSPSSLRANVECRGQGKDGEVFLAHIWFSTYASADGPRLAAVVWDGSENLRDREGAGLDSMMDTSRILIGAISHEVRNLASAAVSAHDRLGALAAAAESSDYQALGVVVKALEKTASSGLRIASKRTAGAANIYTVLDETRIIIEPGCRESGVEICWKIAERLPLVQSDHHSLLQVFLNLVRNSLTAMEGAETRQLSVEAGSERELVTVRFRDTGHGVADPDRLFQPFQTGANATGLGLYVSRETLHSHGGELRWEPQPAGACFVVELWPVEAESEA